MTFGEKLLLVLTVGAVLGAGGMVALGCATTGPGPCMGCIDPLAKDCRDPTAYEPLNKQLPVWPFPSLFVPIPEAK